MKKIISLSLALLCCLLCACVFKNLKPTSLADTVQIPDDGVITKDVFQSLKDNNSVGVFEGQSDSVRYTFTVFGDKISAPADTVMKINVKSIDETSLCFELAGNARLDFSPMLALYLNRAWSADSVEITSDNGSVSTATVTFDSSMNAVVNTIVSQPGVYNVKCLTVSQENITDDDPTALSDVSFASDKSDGTSALYCTFSIDCTSIFNHIDSLKQEKLELLPSDGKILAPTKTSFTSGESVFDVLQRVCRENEIHMEASFTPLYGSSYVEGICNLYEKDCGDLSGWTYFVNGECPSYGCSSYRLSDQDVVEWTFSCNLGYDVGGPLSDEGN